ncbi:MAG: hypothetical protein ACP5LP_03610 [Candidatus Micrarchaeia archaeon]
MIILHAHLTIIIPFVIALVSTYIATKFLLGYMKESGVTAIDHNKKSRPTLPSGIGIAMAFGFTIGVLSYAFGITANIFYSTISLESMFGAVLSVLLISLVGLLDDINVKSKEVETTDMKDTRKGMKQWQKPLLTFIGAIPLMALINSSKVDTILIPFIGKVNFGLAYPLLLVPLAVIFLANAVNLLGGFDGIATGTSLIVAAALFIFSIYVGSYTGALLSGMLLACLIIFVPFNLFPAKMIPGDSFTYGVGAAFVAIAILGNIEIFAVIITLPWTIEFLLHLKKKFKVTDLGKLKADGTFEAPYGKKIYSWTHFIMNIKSCKEWEVSAYMWLIELAFVLLGFALKAINLF